MEVNSSSRGKTVFATEPLWKPSSTTSTASGSSSPKNDLSASRWATTTKNKRTVPFSTIPNGNISPSDANNSNHYTKDMSPDSTLSLNMTRNYGIQGDANPIHPKQNLRDIDNSAIYNRNTTRHIWAPQKQPVHDDIPVISNSDTVLDDDGDVVMMDLNDPGIIKMIAEFTRTERQAGGVSEYADLKPGLRPMVSKSRIAQPSCLLIIDTSFIISHLQLVDNLVNSHPHRKNVVVMPWATIQELDGLKKTPHKRGSLDIGKFARSAINWAFEAFGRLDPGVWGQTKEECEDSNVRGDAAILECCRYFGTSHETILLSNDRNLCVQAMVHDIKTVTITSDVHTAESILARILGNPTSTKDSREPFSHPQNSPLANPTNLVYNPACDYTPPSIPINHQVNTLSIHRPNFSHIQPTYNTADENRQIIQPAFYPITTQNEIDYPYGIKENRRDPQSTNRGGLEASIYAVKNMVPRPQRSTQAIKLARPPLRITRSSLEPKATIRNNKSDAEIKSNLNDLLRRISAELVTNLIPLLKECARDKLPGKTHFTLEALNYCPEKQVHSIIDLEKFFHAHWTSVFYHYLPADYSQVFKSGGLNRRWLEWIYWAEVDESSAIGPTMKEVKKWIEMWDFIWKRILSSEKQTDTNLYTVDQWRTALVDVGLAAE